MLNKLQTNKLITVGDDMKRNVTPRTNTKSVVLSLRP